MTTHNLDQIRTAADTYQSNNDKAALESACRTAGWTGDANRYGIVFDGQLYTGKAALAYWLACHAYDALDSATQYANAKDYQPAAPVAPVPPAANPAIMVNPIPAAPTTHDDGMSQRIASAVGAAVASVFANLPQSVDVETVRAVVREELGQSRPQAIDLTLPEGALRVLPATHRHPMFEKALRLVAAGLNVLLVGPAGTGKTTLAHQVADALGREFGTLHCTAGASESQLLGWLLPVGQNGAFEYVPADFARLYGKGNSLFLLDEIDGGDANMLMVLNSALANGALHVPQNVGQPSIAKGENAGILAAANTFGTGADFVYVGRNQLDAATLDRFYVVRIGYDTALEAAIMGQPAPATVKWDAAPQTTITEDIAALYGWLAGIRAKVEEHGLRRIVSTRAFQKATAARQAGIPIAEIKADLLAGWTAAELAKVGA